MWATILRQLDPRLDLKLLPYDFRIHRLLSVRESWRITTRNGTCYLVAFLKPTARGTVVGVLAGGLVGVLFGNDLSQGAHLGLAIGPMGDFIQFYCRLCCENMDRSFNPSFSPIFQIESNSGDGRSGVRWENSVTPPPELSELSRRDSPADSPSQSAAEAVVRLAAR